MNRNVSVFFTLDNQQTTLESSLGLFLDRDCFQWKLFTTRSAVYPQTSGHCFLEKQPAVECFKCHFSISQTKSYSPPLCWTACSNRREGVRPTLALGYKNAGTSFINCIEALGTTQGSVKKKEKQKLNLVQHLLHHFVTSLCKAASACQRPTRAHFW